jgi:hypothetical protein
MKTGAEMRELLMVYLYGVILVLAASTTIKNDEGISLLHILLAAFAWPISGPVMAWRAWAKR